MSAIGHNTMPGIHDDGLYDFLFFGGIYRRLAVEGIETDADRQGKKGQENTFDHSFSFFVRWTIPHRVGISFTNCLGQSIGSRVRMNYICSR